MHFIALLVAAKYYIEFANVLCSCITLLLMCATVDITVDIISEMSAS